MFKAPTGYRPAKELFDATYSLDKKGEFNELFDEIGYKSDPRTLKNKGKNK